MRHASLRLVDFSEVATDETKSEERTTFRRHEILGLLAIYFRGIADNTYNDYLIDVGNLPKAYFYAFKKDGGRILDKICIVKSGGDGDVSTFEVTVNGESKYCGQDFETVKKLFSDNRFDVKPAPASPVSVIS